MVVEMVTVPRIVMKNHDGKEGGVEGDGAYDGACDYDTLTGVKNNYYG